MTCASNTNRAAQNSASTQPKPKHKLNCCSSCNSQICSSYLVGAIACLLVVGGIFLAFERWDWMWLVVTGVGIVLVFIGSTLYYCGSQSSKKLSTVKRASRPHLELGQSEHLLANAPNLNGTFSVSQLSLNMLPPYYPSFEGMTVSHQPGGISPTTPAISNCGGMSPIMQINGVNFLLLPLGDAITNIPNRSVAFDAQSLLTSKIVGGSLLQVNPESHQTSAQQRGFVLIKPQDLGITSQGKPESLLAKPDEPSQTNNTLVPVRNEEIAVPSSTDTSEMILEIAIGSVGTPNEQLEQEPLYEVPRLPMDSIAEHSQTIVQLCDITQDDEEIVVQAEVDNISSGDSRQELLVNQEEHEESCTSPCHEEVTSCAPPSYDEVTVNKVLGLPKFAYGTL